MNEKRLKYLGYSIVFQEVPNEVSLALNITGCTHRCDGCHSAYLAEDIGDYVDDHLPSLLKRYEGTITCVCFMGGDQAIGNLEYWLKTIKEMGLKTCVYSGEGNVMVFNNCLKYLDYLKVGPYRKNRGGLDNPHTNQRFYEISYCSNGGYSFDDITMLFQKKYD